MSDEQTLVIMDLLVELEDGRLADFEIQKIGYKFPGERAEIQNKIICEYILLCAVVFLETQCYTDNNTERQVQH